MPVSTCGIVWPLMLPVYTCVVECAFYMRTKAKAETGVKGVEGRGGRGHPNGEEAQRRNFLGRAEFPPPLALSLSSDVSERLAKVWSCLVSQLLLSLLLRSFVRALSPKKSIFYKFQSFFFILASSPSPSR